MKKILNYNFNKVIKKNFNKLKNNNNKNMKLKQMNCKKKCFIQKILIKI